MQYIQIVCNRIKQLRLKRNYTQAFMAKKMGYKNAKSYARLENNENEMSFQTLINIYVILRISLIRLLDTHLGIDVFIIEESFEKHIPFTVV